MLEVRNKAGHEHHVEGTVTKHLIGDVYIIASGVSDLWREHRISLPDQSHRLGEPSTIMVRFSHDSC